MSNSDGQVSADAAAIYERALVPALFAEWPPRLLELARLAPGQQLLDVACGTGVVAREARRRAAEVVGVDINPGMLAQARSLDPEIEWRQADAHALPFEDGSFDAVLCQFGLMFFGDRPRALAEMRRVARPGAPVVTAVWAGLGEHPGYATLVDLLERTVGSAAADELRAPFCLGDPRQLAGLFATAGLPEVRVHRVEGEARFDSLAALISTTLRGWTLEVDDAGYARFEAAAGDALARFVGSDGAVRFPSPAYVALA